MFKETSCVIVESAGWRWSFKEFGCLKLSLSLRNVWENVDTNPHAVFLGNYCVCVLLFFFNHSDTTRARITTAFHITLHLLLISGSLTSIFPAPPPPVHPSACCHGGGTSMLPPDAAIKALHLTQADTS